MCADLGSYEYFCGGTFGLSWGLNLSGGYAIVAVLAGIAQW